MNNKCWYVGAMNDGAFVIDAPPRPSTDDINPHQDVNVIAAFGDKFDLADLLVAEHNKAVALYEAVRGLRRVNHKCWCSTWAGGEHEPECKAARAALALVDGLTERETK